MSFKAVLEADIKGFSNNIDKAISDVDRLEKTTLQKLSSLGDSFLSIGKKASIFSAGVAAATTGLFAFAKSTGDMANDLLSATIALDSSSDMLQEYKLVSVEAGTSTDAFSRSVEGLTRRLKDAGEGSGDVSEQIKSLGVSLFDASGGMRRTGDITNDIIKSLAQMDNVSQRNVIASQLFGRAWVDIAPILDLGAEGIDDIRQSAHDMGVVLDSDALNAANNFSVSVNKMGMQLKAIKDNLAAEVAPLLSDTIVPIIEERVIPAINSMADRIGNLVASFNELPQGTKEAIMAITGVAVAIGPALVSLGGLMKILPLISTAITALTGPVGLVVAAIAGAATLIIANWDSIKEYFTTGGGSELFDSIKTLFNTVKDVVSDVFHEIKNTVTTIWNAIGDTLKKIWGNAFDTIVTTITVAFDIVGGVFNTFINLLKGDFSGALESIKTLAENVFDGFKRIVFNSLSSMTAALSEFFSFLGLNSLAETFAGWSEKIKPSTKSIVEDVSTVNDEIKETAVVADTATQSITGLTEELDTFQKLIGEQLNVRDAITKTTATIEDLQSKLVKLQTGILPSTNVRQELAETQQQINDLSTALDLLTGGRELNIDVKTNISGIDADENKFLKDGAIVVPPIDTSILETSLGQAKDMVAITSEQLGSLLSTGISMFAQTIGDAFAGNWDGLGAGLLKAVGSLAQQFGGLVIGMAVAADKLKKIIVGNPFAAIAAGAALIALGAAATGAAQNMISSATGGGGYSSAPSLRDTGPGYAPSEYRGAYQDDFKVEFKIGSNELVGVLDTANQRRNRLG